MREESGAVAIMVAVLITVLILFAAFVIDLGALRADRALGQSVADMSAAAAARSHSPRIPGSSREACVQAVAYAEENLGVTLTPVGDGCDAFPADQLCLESVVHRASFEGGPFSIMIVNPVQDLDSDGLMEGVSYADVDGRPCERIGVQVTRTRGFILAPAGGSSLTGSQTTMSAVGRSQHGDEGEFASLVVLERNGCQTLSNAGGANIRVFDLVTGEGEIYSGTVTVDTLPAGCGGNQKVIQARTATGALIEASGRIIAHALHAVDVVNQFTYPLAAVPDNLRSGLVAPFDPEPGPLITRAPVDDSVNCHPGGYPSGFTWSPDRFGQAIPPCDEGGQPYIRQLRDGVGWVTTRAIAEADLNWAVYPDESLGQTCDGGGTVTPALMGASRLFIDCTATGNISFDPDGLVLSGFSHINVRGTMRIDSGDDLEVVGDPLTGTVLSFPNGGIDHRGGRMSMRNVFAYIDAPDGALSASILSMTGNAEEFVWQAPLQEEGCAGSPPNAACFAPLALWNNGNAMNRLEGGAGGGVIGSVFTPNAPFRVRGSADQSAAPCSDEVTWTDLINATELGLLNLESAQFFAARVDTAGGGMVRMCPSPSTTFEIPLAGAGLIR